MLLRNEDIYLNQTFKNKKEAIQWVGEKMLEKGFIKKKYIKSMHQRDKIASVAIGNYLAIPHAEQDSFQYIQNNGIVFVKLTEPLEWDGSEVFFVIGLALNGDQQMDHLQEIALSFSDEDMVTNFYHHVQNHEDVFKFLTSAQGESKWLKKLELSD